MVSRPNGGPNKCSMMQFFVVDVVLMYALREPVSRMGSDSHR